MPDFVVILGGTERGDPASPAGERLDALRWTRWPWGWLGVAPGGWREHKEGGSWYGAAGRPHERGGGLLSPEKAAAAHEGRAGAYEKISGMFILLRADDTEFSVVTDRLNHLPVYRGAMAGGAVVYSSCVEVLSAAMAPPPTVDRVSVAELLLYEAVTYPYTTREGVRQLAPSSRHAARVEGSAVREQTKTLWTPREPERWPSARECVELASVALEESADEIASGASRIGVQLSGGLDSRVVLAALRDRAEVVALTFLDEPNRESASASAAAAALGVPHRLVRREPEYYSGAFESGQELVGFEQATLPCHGLCLLEQAREDGLDVIVGGFGCDILLKGGHVPYGLGRVLLAERGLVDLSRAPRIRKHKSAHVEKRRPMLAEGLAEEALGRRAAHEEALREFRPRTAPEWAGFYPIGNATSVDVMAMSRLASHDEFYVHAGFVEVSALAPWSVKKGLGLMSALGRRYAGDAACLPHPDTGLPATLPYFRARLAKKLRRSRAGSATRSFSRPWYGDSSFIRYGAYFAQSEAWARLREDALADERSVEALSSVLAVSPRAVIEDGREAGDPLREAIVVQSLRLLARARAANGALGGATA